MKNKKEIKKISMQPDLFNTEETEHAKIQPIIQAEFHEPKKYESLNEVKTEDTATILPDIQSFEKEIIPQKTEVKSEEKNETFEKTNEMNRYPKKIERIVIFYADKSFSEYFPE